MKAAHQEKNRSLRKPLSENEVSKRCALFESECRRRGIRVTAQRLAVYRCVADLSHPTAETVHRRIVARMGALSLATVYRTIEFLEEAGFIRRVSSTESVCRYDANLTPHQHLVCRVCGVIQDWEDETLARVGLPSVIAPGFRAEALDIRVLGLCRACAEGAPPARNPATMPSRMSPPSRVRPRQPSLPEEAPSLAPSRGKGIVARG